MYQLRVAEGYVLCSPLHTGRSNGLTSVLLIPSSMCQDTLALAKTVPGPNSNFAPRAGTWRLDSPEAKSAEGNLARHPIAWIGQPPSKIRVLRNIVDH